jgi:hypothetical protein
MFFLLRMAFWLGLVLILLPSGTSQQGPAASEVHASEAISAASATVGDLRGFCARQPDACAVGAQVATAIGYKAQAGAKMLYDVLSESLAPHETGSLASGTRSHGDGARPVLDRPVLDRTVLDRSARDRSSPQKASQNTLSSADLAPAWRGPPSRKDSARKDSKHAA